MKHEDFKEMLLMAKKKKYAVGAFNIFNYLSAAAALKAAAELNSPIIIQTSTATVKKYGAEELGKMLRLLVNSHPVNAVIHLDHCTSVELAKQCIDAGWDSVMIDASQLPFADNISKTQEVVAYAHGKGVFVEGELGTIEGVEDEISVEKGSVISYEEALIYVEKTSIDAFAPAVGTAHGLYKGNPTINFHMIEQLSHSITCPLVIHGGTGLSEDVFRELVNKGAAKINVSTAIKYAYLNGCKEYFEKNPQKIDPLGFDEYVFEKIKIVVVNHINLFNPQGMI